MTYREDFTLPAELMERVSKQGFDILPMFFGRTYLSFQEPALSLSKGSE